MISNFIRIIYQNYIYYYYYLILLYSLIKGMKKEKYILRWKRELEKLILSVVAEWKWKARSRAETGMAASLIPLSFPTLASPFKGRVKVLEAKPCRCSGYLSFQQRRPRPLFVVNKLPVIVDPSRVRFRLDNLGPQPGSRKKAKRKGRGIAAGQGASCGFGMRGQKSRSGPGVRKGFEGGQMPLYRRIPKLKGIAGGILHLQLSFASYFLCYYFISFYLQNGFYFVNMFWLEKWFMFRCFDVYYFCWALILTW